MKSNVKKIALCGLLSALAYVSLWFIRIPIIPSTSFLRFDIKDVFIAMMGILFGPIYAFAGAFCVSFVQIMTVSEYGIIGLIMNVISATAYTVPIALGYRWKKNNWGIIVGVFMGCILMVVSMLLWNYWITPLYMGVTRETVKQMLIPIFLPFNVIKGGLNSVLLVIVYNTLNKINIVNSINK